MSNAFYKVENSNEVNAELHTIPSWASRYVLPILLSIVFGFPALMYFIVFEDVMTIEVNIFRVGDTGNLIPTADPLRKVFVADEQPVASGNLIGIFQSGDTLTAPINGITKFTYDFDSPKVSLSIVPFSKSIVARGKVTLSDAAKITRGQKILMEITGFPSDDYGFVEGTVEKLSHNSDGYSTIEISLPEERLITLTGKNIDPPGYCKAVGKISIGNERLLSKIVKSLSPNKQRPQ